MVVLPNLAQQYASFRYYPRPEALPGVPLASCSWQVVGVVWTTHAPPLPASSGASFRYSTSYDRNDPIQHPGDQDGQRRTTRRIGSIAAAL